MPTIPKSGVKGLVAVNTALGSYTYYEEGSVATFSNGTYAIDIDFDRETPEGMGGVVVQAARASFAKLQKCFQDLQNFVVTSLESTENAKKNRNQAVCRLREIESHFRGLRCLTADAFPDATNNPSSTHFYGRVRKL